MTDHFLIYMSRTQFENDSVQRLKTPIQFLDQNAENRLKSSFEKF